MKTPLLYLSLLVAVLFSCKKYEVPNQTISNSNAETTSEFNWTTTNELKTQLVFENELANRTFSFELLDENFNRIYKLFKESGNNQMEIDQLVSNQMDSIYLYAPNQNLFLKFGVNQGQVMVSGPADNNLFTTNPEGGKQTDRDFTKSGCTSCSRTLGNGSGNHNINTYEKVCVTGNHSAGFTFNNGGKISICGTLTLNYINVNGSGSVDIVVNPGGKLIVNNMNLNGKGTVVNNGTLEFNNTHSISTIFVNNGSLLAKQTLNINSGAHFTNNNDVVINGDANFNDYGYNYGSMLIYGDLKNNTVLFENHCSLDIREEFHVDAIFKNFGFIKVGTTSFINGGGDLFMANQTLIKTQNAHFNSPDVTSNGTGVIAISNSTTINSGFDVDNGFIDICDANGIETNNASASTLTHLKFCATTVAADGNCFFEGHTANTSGGSGGRAGSLVYPSSGFAWRAFEDLWPAKGDYDFNDMIIKYRLEAESNSSNHLTQVEIEMEIPALGAAFNNGMALQLLEKNGNNYTRVSGSYFVSGSEGTFKDPNDASVVIITPNIFQTIPNYYRNVGDGAEGTPYQTTVTIQVDPNANIDLNDLVFDLFLFRSENRGLEVHLPGLPPSAAVNNSLFNTVDDASGIAGFYRTAENFPWGIEVINTSEWKHPLSKVKIWDAYPQFNTWVASEGSQATDWFNNPVSNLVYTLPPL